MCDYYLLDLCLTRPPVETGFAIFGFSEFLTALALLILVFNSSDFLYHFRTSIAPIPLRSLSFMAAIFIGGGSLLTDLWFAEQWYALPWSISRAAIQGVLGALFLSMALLWIWFAYERPPAFGRRNYKRFYNTLFRTIIRGSETQLPVVAGELVRSAESLIKLSLKRDAKSGQVPLVAKYAQDTLLLLANRKLCRHIVASSPTTAMELMYEALQQEAFHAPLGEFGKLITTEALRNRDSIIYHEDITGADVLGWVQAFSTTMYGSHRLVEGVGTGMSSPLDLDHDLAWSMDGEQFDAYCRIVLVTFRDYMETGGYETHSTAICRALRIIEDAGRELYTLDKMPLTGHEAVAYKRFSAAVMFVELVLHFLGEQSDLKFGRLRVGKKGARRSHRNVFDYLAELMFELLDDAATVRSPPDTAWSIQYSSLWGRFFTFSSETDAWKVIRFKFSRLVFDEIKRLEELPNYRGSRILGLCLNVMGLSPPSRADHRDDYRLRKAVLRWTKRNYLRLVEVHPRVAADCLSGDITFEPEKRRLVKTYALGLGLEPSREYLLLDPVVPDQNPRPQPSRADVAQTRRARKRRTRPTA